MPVTLRPAVPSDAPAIAEIWHSGWRDGHLGNVPDELLAIRTPESFHERATACLAATTVADHDGTVAGFIMVTGDEVEQVYVDARHRGSGVAGALLAAAESQVASHGHRQAWLAVVAGNTRARRFYERSGWRDEGPFEHAAPAPGGTVAVPAHRYVKDV